MKPTARRRPSRADVRDRILTAALQEFAARGFERASVDDVAAEHERLVAAGATVTMPPTPAGPVTVMLVDDTCGNLVQLAQHGRG